MNNYDKIITLCGIILYITFYFLAYGKKESNSMTFDEWLKFGIDNGYCTDQFCNTHDGGPMHETEEIAWDQGNDPCQHVVRLGSYDDWEYPLD